MLDIHNVLHDLAARRPIFHLEADFQFALAWRIKEMMPHCEVRLEFPPFPGQGMYVDIWLPTIGTIIELKYYTQAFDVEAKGERFSLTNQGAQPLSRYDFVKDVGRLERLVEEKSECSRGHAILLTNDQSYWKAPAPRWKTTMDADFRLHADSTLGGNLNWKDGSNPRTIKNREQSLSLRGSYKLHWRDYSDFQRGNNGRFCYLAITVGEGV